MFGWVKGAKYWKRWISDFLHLIDFTVAPKKRVGAKKKERELARKWRKEGKTNKEIAKLLGKWDRWVQKWCNCGRLTLTDKTRSRRPSKLCQRSSCFIQWTVSGQNVFQLWLTIKGTITWAKILKSTIYLCENIINNINPKMLYLSSNLIALSTIHFGGRTNCTPYTTVVKQRITHFLWNNRKLRVSCKKVIILFALGREKLVHLKWCFPFTIKSFISKYMWELVYLPFNNFNV